MANSLANYGLLGLTAAILTWAGRDIYRRAWNAVRHRSADMAAGLPALGDDDIDATIYRMSRVGRGADGVQDDRTGFLCSSNQRGGVAPKE